MADMYWFDHEWPPIEAGRPMGPVTSIAEAPDGVLYVLGRGRAMDPLVALSPDGRFLRAVRTWDDGLFGYPHGLRIDRAGNLWATDLEHNQVYKFDRDGRLLLSLGTRGQRGDGPGHFDAPTDVGNSLLYHEAIALHAKRDEQIRTLGNIVTKLVG